MKYKATLYIADKQINNFMEDADLKPNYKVFIRKSDFFFSTKKKVNDKFFHKIIKKSKDEPTFWIPAIEFCGTLYVDDGIKEISTGENIIFIPWNDHEHA